MSQHQDNITVARRVFDAYVKRDRAGIEALLADDLRFTSPLDNGLNRQRYMSHCWSAGQDIEQFAFIHLLAAGDQVFVTYEGRRAGGDRFRNTEILTVKHGKVTEAEVYFGLVAAASGRAGKLRRQRCVASEATPFFERLCRESIAQSVNDTGIICLVNRIPIRSSL